MLIFNANYIPFFSPIKKKNHKNVKKRKPKKCVDKEFQNTKKLKA